MEKWYNIVEENKRTIEKVLDDLKDIIDNPDRVYVIKKEELPNMIKYYLEVSNKEENKMDDEYGMLLEKVLDKRNRSVRTIEQFPIYLYLGRIELMVIARKFLRDKKIYFDTGIDEIIKEQVINSTLFGLIIVQVNLESHIEVGGIK